MRAVLIGLLIAAPTLVPRTPVRVVAAPGPPGDTAFVEDFERRGIDRWMELKLADETTRYEVVQEGSNHVLRAVSAGTASALWTAMVPSPSGGTLSWRWRVERPLLGNDREREREGDDFAARVFLIFGEGALEPGTRALCYVWAAHEPVGALYPNPRFPDVATVVVESGAARAGEWVGERRDWVADYERAFGTEAEPVSAVAILVDTDDTGLRATAWFDDIRLR